MNKERAKALAMEYVRLRFEDEWPPYSGRLSETKLREWQARHDRKAAITSELRDMDVDIRVTTCSGG